MGRLSAPRLIAGLLLLLGFAACGDQDKEALKTPIPRQLLFGYALPRAVQLSPDGRFVSYIAHHEDAPEYLGVAGGGAWPIAAFDHPAGARHRGL